MTSTAGRAGDFLRIVERNPDLVFVIDHMNVSDETAKAGKIPEAIAEVVAFAKYPNVQVKMSSIPHKSSQAYPFRDLTDHIHRVFDAFGPRRSFWGTDLTRVPCTYTEAVTAFTQGDLSLTDEQLRLLMGEAIARWLPWPTEGATG